VRAPGGAQVLLEKRHPGGLGLQDAPHLRREDRARAVAVEAGEPVERALDQDLERHRPIAGEGLAVQEQVGRAQELHGYRSRRDEHLRSHPQEIGRKVRRKTREISLPENLVSAVRLDTPDRPQAEPEKVPRALAPQAAPEAGEHPGIVTPGRTVERDLDNRRITVGCRLRHVEGERRPAGEARREEHSVGALGGQATEIARRRSRLGPTLALRVAARLTEGAEGVDQGFAQRAA
jgi:hypothetical protein